MFSFKFISKKFLALIPIFIFSLNVHSFEMNQSCRDKRVRIYTKSKCSYCIKLKSILKNNFIEYEEFEISRNKMLAGWLYSSTKQTTVPYVYLGDEFVGGFTEFKKLCSKL